MKALLAVQAPGATVALDDQSLLIRRGATPLSRKPLAEIEEVHLYGFIELTAAARQALLRQDIDTLFLTPTGEYLGRLQARRSRTAERRLAQLRALNDPQTALATAHLWVAAKLHNQRALCLRLARSHPNPPATAAAVALRRLMTRDAPDLDTLRGIEGQAAALYFRALGAAIQHPDLTFTHRTRRPPRDPVNACLSFGYTLLLRRVESALHRAGLDPHLGALHAPDHGKPALALDVLEPFRPFVDRLVLRLINRRQLGPSDFVHPEIDAAAAGAPPTEAPTGSPAVHLGPSARPLFLQAFQDLWRSPVDGEPKRATLRDHLDALAVRLARRFEGQDLPLNPPRLD